MPGRAVAERPAQPNHRPSFLLLRTARFGDRRASARRCQRGWRPAAHPIAARDDQGQAAAVCSALVGRWHADGSGRVASRTDAARARGGDPFVCSVLSHRRGRPIQRAAIRRRFLSACKVLGLARLRTLTIHHGRHTFISHALAGGRTLAEVRAAAGHSNVAITSGYLHVVVDEDEGVEELFGEGCRSGK
jgi:Phage integrase family